MQVGLKTRVRVCVSVLMPKGFGGLGDALGRPSLRTPCSIAPANCSVTRPALVLSHSMAALMAGLGMCAAPGPDLSGLHSNSLSTLLNQQENSALSPSTQGVGPNPQPPSVMCGWDPALSHSLSAAVGYDTAGRQQLLC